jgi:hypothetical protein
MSDEAVAGIEPSSTTTKPSGRARALEKLSDRARALGKLSGLVFVVGLGVAIVLAFTGNAGLLLPVGVIFGAGLVLAIVALTMESRKAKVSLFKLSIAMSFSSPIIVVALITAFKEPVVSSAQYIAVVGGVSVAVGVLLSSFLKSSVDGDRRDALELALAMVTIIGAATTLGGVLKL